MLLQDLTLHDFRTYGGRQTIRLAPDEKDKPIILIGGLNGAGKTTMLDALQLVLYGQRDQCASRGGLAYKTFLRQSIHRRADPSSGAAVELTFSHASEGREHEYHVRRTWYATRSGLRERVEVEVDGILDPVLTEQWDERVDDFAPHRVSQLFFFDGEKIAELAEEETSADVLKTAVHSLLGLELVDRLVKDLALLDQKKRRGGNISFDRATIEKLAADRERLATELSGVTQERATINSQLDRARNELRKIEDHYRTQGGELAEQRTRLEAQGETLEASILDRRERLREVTLGCLPLAAVQDLLTKIDEQAHVEEEAGHHSLIADVLEHRDAHVLQQLNESGASQGVVEQLKLLLADDRKNREIHQDDPSYLNLDPEDVRQLDRLVKAELPAQVEQAKALFIELDSLHEQLLILERKLKSIPEEGDLAELRDKRSEALEAVELLKAQLKAQEDQRERLSSQEESTNKSYARELEKELAAAQSNEGLHRKLERINVASATLDEFRDKILTSNLDRVEGAILESFQDLIRKPDLIKRIEIDPQSFSLRLTDGMDQTLHRDALSAGEMQLLAVAILWGLARTSGLPLPVVIDTPLGRLDSVHRLNLVERYFPRASHQVLLLSTDEEIKESRLVDLEPYIGRSYLLEYNAEDDRTVIREGYFEN